MCSVLQGLPKRPTVDAYSRCDFQADGATMCPLRSWVMVPERLILYWLFYLYISIHMYIYVFISHACLIYCVLCSYFSYRFAQESNGRWRNGRHWFLTVGLSQDTYAFICLSLLFSHNLLRSSVLFCVVVLFNTYKHTDSLQQKHIFYYTSLSSERFL